jgi:MFS family permease
MTDDHSPYAVLQLPDYRLLLISRLMVTVAVQIQGIAVGWQIYAITNNPLFLGLAGLTEAIPAIGVALYAGHVADIVDRRKIVLWAVAILALSLGILTACSYSSQHSPTLLICLFLVIALSGFARGFYGPAIFGIVSDIVPRPLLGNAAAWNSTVWQASAVIGPILGGFMYALLHAANTYLFSTILLIAAFISFSQVKSRTVIVKSKHNNVFDNIKEGLDFVFHNQIVLGAMALDLFAVLFGGAVALLPIFAKEVFHCGPEVLGVLRAAPSLGSVITAMVLTHKPITHNSGKVFMFAAAGFGACMIAFGLSTNLYLSIFILALSGALDGISVWVRSTIFQLVTPNEMKGRVSAVNNMFIGSSNEIGEFESGTTAKLMGLVPSVVFGGIMTLLVVLITSIRAPKLRNLHVHELYKEETVKA